MNSSNKRFGNGTKVLPFGTRWPAPQSVKMSAWRHSGLGPVDGEKLQGVPPGAWPFEGGDASPFAISIQLGRPSLSASFLHGSVLICASVTSGIRSPSVSTLGSVLGTHGGGAGVVPGPVGGGVPGAAAGRINGEREALVNGPKTVVKIPISKR